MRIQYAVLVFASVFLGQSAASQEGLSISLKNIGPASLSTQPAPIYPGWLRWSGAGPAFQATLNAHGAGEPEQIQAALPRPRSSWRRIKNGLGFDFPLHQRGRIYFDLYQRTRPKGPGLRLPLATQPLLPTPQQASWSWSLGAAGQLVRTESGQRFVRMVPQLRLRRDNLKRVHNCEARLEYGYWHGGGRRASLDERVLQIRLGWKF